MTNDTNSGTRKKAALGLLIGLALGLSAPSMASHTGRVPRCQEDEFVRGTGDFDHGKWSEYICFHPDDFVQGYIENEFRNPAVHASVGGSVCEHKRFWNRQEGIRIMPESCDR
jgi:hypothetical protein